MKTLRRIALVTAAITAFALQLVACHLLGDYGPPPILAFAAIVLLVANAAK